MEKKSDSLMKSIMEKNNLGDRLLGIQDVAEKEGWSAEKLVTTLLAEMKKEGIETTAEDIGTMIKEQTRIELSPDQLENVSGGGCFGDREKCCTKSGSCYAICADGSDGC